MNDYYNPSPAPFSQNDGFNQPAQYETTPMNAPVYAPEIVQSLPEQAVEITEAVQHSAETAVAQARTSFDTFRLAAEEARGNVEAAVAAASAGVNELHSKRSTPSRPQPTPPWITSGRFREPRPIRTSSRCRPNTCASRLRPCIRKAASSPSWRPRSPPALSPPSAKRSPRPSARRPDCRRRTDSASRPALRAWRLTAPETAKSVLTGACNPAPVQLGSGQISSRLSSVG